MKLRIITMLTLSMIFLSSCAKLQLGFEEESPFTSRGSVISIYLAEASKGVNYRVYINNEDTKVSLQAQTKTRFGVSVGKTKIQVVKAHETASIEMFVNKSNEYYLKIFLNEQGKIELLQIPKSAIPNGVKTTDLYLDQEREKEIKSAQATEILTDYGSQPAFEMETKGVDENTKIPENGDVIFYYELDDGE